MKRNTIWNRDIGGKEVKNRPEIGRAKRIKKGLGPQRQRVFGGGGIFGIIRSWRNDGKA